MLDLLGADGKKTVILLQEHLLVMIDDLDCCAVP